MKTSRPDYPWLEPIFFENQRRFPREQLQQYAGQYIAWSWDGLRVVASDVDRQALDDKLHAAGIDLNRIVHDYVDEADVDSVL